jgi:hypothetical protein
VHPDDPRDGQQDQEQPPWARTLAHMSSRLTRLLQCRHPLHGTGPPCTAEVRGDCQRTAGAAPPVDPRRTRRAEAVYGLRALGTRRPETGRRAAPLEPVLDHEMRGGASWASASASS